MPHQSFELRAVAPQAQCAWWYLVSVVEDCAEFLLVFTVCQLPRSLGAIQFINGGMHIAAYIVPPSGEHLA